MRFINLFLFFALSLSAHDDNHSHIEEDGTGTVNGHYVGPGETLHYINFNQADFEGANLSGADLTGCQFVLANFTDVNLSGANLTNVNFYFSNLSNTNLNNAFFLNTNLSNANLTNVSIEGLFSVSTDSNLFEINWPENPRLILNQSDDLINWTPVSASLVDGENYYYENFHNNKFFKIIIN